MTVDPSQAKSAPDSGSPEAGPVPDSAELYGLLTQLGTRLPSHVRDEVVQDAAMKLLRRPTSWEDVGSVKAYCWTTLKSSLADVLNRDARAGEPLDADDVLADLDPADLRTLQAELQRLLSLLDARDAEVLRLRYLKDMTLKEMVDDLRARGRLATEASLESRLRRARGRLRDLLVGYGFGAGPVAVALMSAAV